jgi:hypothetical protein
MVVCCFASSHRVVIAWKLKNSCFFKFPIMNSHEFSFNEDISQVVFARYDNSYNVDNMV